MFKLKVFIQTLILSWLRKKFPGFNTIFIKEQSRLKDNPIQISHMLNRMEADFVARETYEEALNAFIKQQLQSDQSMAHHSGPIFFTVIMSCYNPDGELLKKAIDSVIHQQYSAWELIIVGYTLDPELIDLIKSTNDPRIQILSSDRKNTAYQRNLGIAAAKGSVITYLDSDNLWFPQYLGSLAIAFQDPAIQAVYTAQIVNAINTTNTTLRAISFDKTTFLNSRGIDGNVYSHRIELYHRLGGWDPTLTRFLDQDLIMKYSVDASPVLIPIIGGTYEAGIQGSISSTEPFYFNKWKLKVKYITPYIQKIRVLVLTGVYPQVVENYIHYELDALKLKGVELAVWRHAMPVEPYDLCQHKLYASDLEAAIKDFKPDIIHSYWLHEGTSYKTILEKFNLPITFRLHSSETTNKIVRELTALAMVKSIFVFPHYIGLLSNKAKLIALPASIDGYYFYPERHKNRKLVVRSGSYLRTNHYEDFIDLAALCPAFEFVLVLARTNNSETYDQDLQRYNAQRGNKVKIIGPLQLPDMSKLVRHAAFYVHTYKKGQRMGMPISIIEAMATGALVLVRDAPEARMNYQQAAAYYKNLNQAATILNGSLTWNEETWRKKWLTNVEFAFKNYASMDHMETMFRNWTDILKK